MEVTDHIPEETHEAYLSFSYEYKLRVYDFILSLLKNECSQPHSASFQGEALQADD